MIAIIDPVRAVVCEFGNNDLVLHGVVRKGRAHNLLKAIGARDGDREMAAGAGDARAKTRQADVDAKGGRWHTHTRGLEEKHR